MRIKESVSEGIGILSFDGNLVLDEATELRTLIKPYLEEQKFSGLICNLEGVEYIDSSGIGILVSIFKSLKRFDKKFALTGLNQRNREVLNLSKLDKLLIIAPDNESAIKILTE